MVRMEMKTIQRVFLLVAFAVLLTAIALPRDAAAAGAVECPVEREGVIGFDSLLLGGFFAGKWVPAEELQGTETHRFNRIWGGEEYSIYSSNGFEGVGKGSAIHKEHPGEFENARHEPDAPIFDVTMENGRTLGFGSARLAIRCNWNPAPRRAIPLDTKNAVYNKIIKEYLGRNGLPDAKPNIMQLFKVDLNGNGQDEVIIYAQNIVGREAAAWEMDKPLFFGSGFPNTSKKGDYSVLLLRKIVDGQVREIPLAHFIALKDGTPFLHKIYQCADLNGDGIMEIITGEYSNGRFSYIVHEIKGGKAVQALINGAGGSKSGSTPLPKPASTETAAYDTVGGGISGGAAQAQDTTSSNAPAAKKVGNEQSLLGKHMFSLQWLLFEKPKYGTANITRKNTGLYIDARHEVNGDYAVLKGDLTVISSSEFTVNGELVTRVGHINSGKECPRIGTFTFKATGKRKYWRMQEMENPCDSVADYVDVYF